MIPALKYELLQMVPLLDKKKTSHTKKEKSSKNTFQRISLGISIINFYCLNSCYAILNGKETLITYKCQLAHTAILMLTNTTN